MIENIEKSNATTGQLCLYYVNGLNIGVDLCYMNIIIFKTDIQTFKP